MRFLLLTAACVAMFGSHAQTPTAVDITLVDNGKGQIEARARTDAFFDGVISAFTFTVRWPASAGLALDTAERCYPFQHAVPVNASPVVENAGYFYRTFNGMGMSTLADNDTYWAIDREYPVCTADILVEGTAFEIVNDAFTQMENRNYFVSLNGVDRTGAIFQRPLPFVAIRSEEPGTGAMNIVLTPNAAFFGWVTDIGFTVRWPSNAGVTLAEPVQDPEVAEYLTVAKEGLPVTVGSYIYQRFRGEGQRSIANSADAWAPDQDLVILSIPYTGQSTELVIAEDTWTAGNDADVFIDLNGNDQVGTIENGSTSMATATNERISARMYPSPGGFDLQVQLPASASTARLAIYSATGQCLWSTVRERAHGRMDMRAAMGDVPEGLYILNVIHGEHELTQRVIR